AMDSLLALPGYIPGTLAADKASLSLLTSAVTSRYMRTDPLGLFRPVLGRLSELNPTSGNNVVDGHILTDDGATGVVFFDSPYSGSESGRNKAMLDSLSAVINGVVESAPDVKVTLTGGPVVAVENASRIKKDSFIALALALVLICVVLFFSYRRLSDVLWIAFSILCGGLFALGLISIFKSTISIIVLGIGAMILGVAVNYPLHYVDHMKYEPDKKKALREIVPPLVVGNVTTVGAFLSLLLVRAGGLRDFGLVGALMLVGTIVFSLVFLPVLATARREKATNTIKLDFDRHIKLSPLSRKIVFLSFLALTVFFGVMSRRTGFDSDMHNINYMTPEESRGFEVLASMGGEKSGEDLIYCVAKAPEASEALRLMEEWGVSPISAFVPTGAEQARRIERWYDFVLNHPSLLDDLSREASLAGFSATAFEPFAEVWNTSFEVRPLEWFDPLRETLGKSMIADLSDGVGVVGYRRCGSDEAAGLKAELAAGAPEGCFVFDSSDVSSRLAGLLNEDFDSIGLICSLIVFFFLLLSFGSVEMSIMSFLPLAVGWIWILGLMSLFGLQFNIVNIILATFIFGMGDDYTIFITEGLMYEYASGRKILHSYKNSVALSALIMFIGIGALVVSRHPAMRSVGLVTVIGMFVVVVMAYYLPPLVFRWLTTKKGVVREVPITLGRLWNSFLAISFFILAILLITPVVCVLFLLGKETEEKKLRYHKFLQGLSRFIINHIPGCRFTWSNPFGEDFSKPAVVLCNHQSHLDVMAAMMLTPKLVVLTNDWAWNTFYGPLIHRAEFYPASEGIEGLRPKLQSLVERGYSILVFPEGTRSADCSIGRFHRGAFVMARELGVDLLPLNIHGFGYALPKKDFMLRRADLFMTVGARISSATMGEDMKAVTREFRAMYVKEYDEIRKSHEDAEYNSRFVRYQYMYKGSGALAEMRQVLRKETYREIDAYDGEDTLTIEDSGYGVYALLFALSHPEVSVVAREADEEAFLTATRCSGIPSNLKYERK
ncbi:MAG: MMPL family transporter, partial [Bacteroidales bacterium]|nr:MMPL family transporter [Bacteroidales bacterium]